MSNAERNRFAQKYLLMVGVDEANGERVCSAEIDCGYSLIDAFEVMGRLVNRTDADAFDSSVTRLGDDKRSAPFDRGSVEEILANPLPIMGFSIEVYTDAEGTEQSVDFDLRGMYIVAPSADSPAIPTIPTTEEVTQ